MREILFRGKNELTNKWEFGSLHIQKGEVNENDSQELEYRILGLRGEIDYVIPESVSEFTGLTDKNGKKIFEGDIVEYKAEKYVVCYGKHDIVCCGCCYKSHQSVGFYLEYESFNGNICAEEDNWENLEIIGNIHDNPELLGGGE